MICQVLFLATNDKEKGQTPPLLDVRSKTPQLPPWGQEKSSQHIKAAGAMLLKTFDLFFCLFVCFLPLPSSRCYLSHRFPWGLKHLSPHLLDAEVPFWELPFSEESHITRVTALPQGQPQPLIS